MNPRLLSLGRSLSCAVVTVLAVSVTGSCRSSKPRATEPAPTKPSASQVPADSAVLPRATTAPPSDAESGIAGKAFFQAMALGRQATRSKSHLAAVEAFSKAIALAPNNGRAYAERGYAELLAGSLPAATSDLERASHLTSDRQLLAQVAFNQGLVSEKTGNTEEAGAAFSRSNILSPSTAARAKMGVGACAGVVEVETPHASSRPGWLLDGHGGQGVMLAKSWRDLVDMTLEEPDAGVLAEKEARELFLTGPETLSHEVSDPPPPRFLASRNHGSTASFEMDVVHVRADGSLLVFHSGLLPARTGAGAIYDCVNEAYADAVIDHDVIHATISSSLSTAREGAAIGTEGFDESTDCVDAGRTVEDLFFDTRSGRLLLKTTRSSPNAAEPPVGLRLERGVVFFRGKGCDEQLSLVRD